MQQINKRLVMSALALLVATGASLSGSAFAEHGSSSTTISNSGSSSHDSIENSTTVKTSATGSSETPQVENETETETEHSQTLKEQFKEMAQAKVQADLKAKAQTKTAEQKQQACTARKDNLTKRMANNVAAADKHKTTFDNIYTKVQNFYTNKNLSVSNYDTLKAATDKAQQDAADQIVALKALDINVDCTQTDSLATNLTAFQSAVQSTRDSLKAYRKALVDLITALHGASTSTDKTSSDNSSTNSTTTQ